MSNIDFLLRESLNPGFAIMRDVEPDTNLAGRTLEDFDTSDMTDSQVRDLEMDMDYLSLSKDAHQDDSVFYASKDPTPPAYEF